MLLLSISPFLRPHVFKLVQITEEEKSKFEIQLRRVFASSRIKGDAAFDLNTYFRVPFEQATMMVGLKIRDSTWNFVFPCFKQ